jgi:aspartyl-tRNA(Asn)/glutamyl-tRNA(Gln) amidotransferase subunit A
MGFSAEGLPLGIQFMGPAFGEAGVLAIAHAFERATPWRGHRPAAA